MGGVSERERGDASKNRTCEKEEGGEGGGVKQGEGKTVEG